MDRNVQKRIRATCEFSFHTEISSNNHRRKKKISSQEKEKTFIESLKAEFGLKQVLNISTRGANHLPWLGNAAAASCVFTSFVDLSLALQAFVMLRSVSI